MDKVKIPWAEGGIEGEVAAKASMLFRNTQQQERKWESTCLTAARCITCLPPPSPRETSIHLHFDGKEEGVQQRLTLKDALVINSLISEEMV